MMWIKGALAVLEKYKVAIGVIASIVALLISLGQLHDWVYSKGYEAAKNDIQAEINKEAEKQKAETEQKIKAALSKQAELHQSDIDRVRSEQQVKIETKEVVKYVERIKVVDECISLASDTVRLLSAATGLVTARGAGESSSPKNQQGAVEVLPEPMPIPLELQIEATDRASVAEQKMRRVMNIVTVNHETYAVCFIRQNKLVDSVMILDGSN